MYSLDVEKQEFGNLSCYRRSLEVCDVTRVKFLASHTLAASTSHVPSEFLILLSLNHGPIKFNESIIMFQHIQAVTL